MDLPPDKGIRLSVVIPAMNEEESLPLLADRLASVLDSLPFPSEVWFVDDGSTDRTFEVMTTLCGAHAGWHALKFRRNFGKTAALLAGFERAEGDFIITMDADLQDDPREIPRFLEKLEEGYDLVVGWKHPRKDPISKTLPSKVINWIVGKVTNVKLHDINCGFKAYRRSVIEEISIRGELHRYIPVLAEARGFRLTEIQVHHVPRQFGRSKFGVGRFFRGFSDLLTVLFLTRFAVSPLRVFGAAGMVCLATGAGISFYMAWLRFVCDAPIGTRPLFAVGVQLVLVGVQLLLSGLLGEMLALYNGQAKTSCFAVIAESAGGSQRKAEERRKLGRRTAHTRAATSRSGRARIRWSRPVSRTLRELSFDK